MSDLRDPLLLLEEALEAMLVDNEDISARGVVRRMDGIFKHATDITRPAKRRSLLERYRRRQADLRALMQKADKQSKAALSARLLRKEQEIAELIRQRDLLVASHKAAVLAVGEMGGMTAWLRFFQHYPGAAEDLRSLSAVPSAEVHRLDDRRDPSAITKDE